MIIYDGESFWTIDRDGKEVPLIPTVTSVSVDEQKVLDYDPENKVLKVNPNILREGELEKIAENCDKSPEGSNIAISIPFSPPGLYKGVKRIESLSEQEEKKPFFRRVINYIRNYLK